MNLPLCSTTVTFVLNLLVLLRRRGFFLVVARCLSRGILPAPGHHNCVFQNANYIMNYTICEQNRSPTAVLYGRRAPSKEKNTESTQNRKWV
jgi:hypothetical protein